MSRKWKWIALLGVAIALPIAAIVVVADATRMRAAIVQFVTAKTGRQLSINGDLKWRLDWPRLHLHGIDVAFANPSWATEKQMFAAPVVELAIDLPRLLRGTLFLSEVRLDRPAMFFETGTGGLRSWRFDDDPKGGQNADNPSIAIGRLTLHDGRIRYDDSSAGTSIVAELSHRSTDAKAGDVVDYAIVFSAKGKYVGLPLTATGEGGSLHAAQDERTPYPISIVATVGRTSVRAKGTITNVLKPSAIDADVALRGSTLAELFDLVGIALPETRPYDLTGHLTQTAHAWRYEKFSGRIGQSELTGSLRIDDTDGPARPLMKGTLAFQSLNLADLGPVVGKEVASPAQPAKAKTVKAAATKSTPGARALPAVPFRRDRWTTIDADVSLTAQTILRPQALPLEQLTTRLRMRESVLTLEPLDFSVAGGHLDGVIRLDGQQSPIRGHSKMRARGLLLGKVLPTIPLAKSAVGSINGDIELTGVGDSVARLLATADGKVVLVVEKGKVSKLLMQQVAMHVPEIVLQHVTGDELIDVRCGVASFDVENGIMNVGVLVLDTDVTKVVGHGTVNLANEKLDLTLIPRTKRMSFFALRGPISVHGDLAHPDMAVDVGRVGARGLAAVALGALNPALSLIALVDPTTSKDSNCAALTERARTPARKTASAGKKPPG